MEADSGRLRPWIQPLDNNGQVLSPWLDSDIVMATTMVGTFVEVLKTLYEKFEGTFFLCTFCCVP